MEYYNIGNKAEKVNLETAVFQGVAAGNNLYMPTEIPKLPSGFLDELPKLNFPEIAFEVAQCWLSDDIGKKELKAICKDAFSFPIPLAKLAPHLYTQELFHGPSMAFKDVGARFMSRIMQHLLKGKDRKTQILVATSGDTGGAVALGFLGMPGIDVTILYPKDKITPLQQKQLTTVGGNVKAFAVEGTFDDCQDLVKQAFLDENLAKKHGLTSANSINILRLLPQSFYYFLIFQQLAHLKRPIVVSVPSGNFGNICAGLLAKKMGLPIYKFVASTNENRAFSMFMKTGNYRPLPTMRTISNAMDVGNPSNFTRVNELMEGNLQNFERMIESHAFTDAETLVGLNELLDSYMYISEPHGAIGYLGLKKALAGMEDFMVGVFLGTAHPVKFLEVLPENIRSKVAIPRAAAELLKIKSKQMTIDASLKALGKVL
jgi:threonine synthase